jgi:HEAT repeat protein
MQAVDALATLDAKEAAPDILSLLDSDNDIPRLQMLSALARLGVPLPPERFLPLLNDPFEAARAAACRVAGDHKIREAIPQLLERVRDADWNVRQSAIEALGKLGAREAVPRIREALNHEVTVSQAARALAAILGRDAVPELVVRLKSFNRYTRQEVVATLLAMNAKEAAADLVPLLADEDPMVRHAVEVGFARLQAGDRVEQIAALLEHPESDVQVSAAKALCRLGSRRGVPRILEAGPSEALFLLNALREPELWARLDGLSVEKISGPRHEVLGRVAAQAGLAFKPDEGLRHWDWRPDGTAALEYLEWTKLPLVLERDALRAPAPEAALAFWKEWWASQK